MENQKVLDAAKALNGTVYEDEEKEAKVPLIKTKIKTASLNDEDLVIAFMQACESIPEENERYIPDEIADVYNALRDEREASTKEENPVEKSTKKKVDRKPPDREKDAFGNIIGTMTATIAAMLVKGAKKEDIVKELCEKFGRTEVKATNYLKGCLKTWKSRGLVIAENDGISTMQLPKK